MVVVFANWDYVEILLNWLKAMSRLGISHTLVFALDKATHQFMLQHRFNSVLTELQGDLKDLWILRMQVFNTLVHREIPFIHSDVDAVWVRNPIPKYFTPDSEYDLVASPGTIFPQDVLREWGFVLCCGLFYMNGSDASNSLLEQWHSHVLESGDDQVSLNRILCHVRKITWDFSCQYTIACEAGEIKGSYSMMSSCGSGLCIGVLPFKKFPRLAEIQDRPYVVHPLTPKASDATKAALKAFDLWFL